MTKTELTKYEKSILLFFLKGTLSDLSKALIFFFIFYALGFHKEFFCGLFFLIIFRIFSGGIHCKTYPKCLLLSFVILSSGIMLGSYIAFSKAITISLTIFSGFITIMLTPILAATRPSPSKENVRKAKLQECVVIIIFLLCLAILDANPYINIGFWMLILHTIQLMVAKLRR